MIQSVDLLLVNPGNRAEQFGNLAPLATVAQPLGIALLAAYARSRGITVAILDAEAEALGPVAAVDAIEARYSARMVGLTAFTTKMTAAGAILREVKRRRPAQQTLIGGHHPSALPERTLREEAVDFVIKGEGFFPVAALLQGVADTTNIRGLWYLNADGSVHDGGQAPGIQDLDSLPRAAWDLLPMHLYRAHHWQAWGQPEIDTRGFALIYTSLGCPFDCDYCSVNVVYEKHRVRYRSPALVVDEIEHLIDRYGVRYFEIIDDTFTVNRHHVEALCDEIVARNLGGKINAWCFSRVDRADPRFLSKMKAAGINWVFMGFESGNDTVLLGVNKRQTVGGIKRAVDAVHAAGINVGGNFVFGLPEDTPESMEQTFVLAQELNVEYANFFIMMAYPGARLRETAIGALPQRWSQYGFFTPDALPLCNVKVTAREMVEFRDRAFANYFGSARYQDLILKRFGPGTLRFLKEKVLSLRIERRAA